MAKRTFNPLLAVAVVLIVVLYGSLFWRGNARSNLAGWQTNFETARAAAAAAHRQMFVEFSASWCEPCQLMKQKTWSDDRVAAALKDYVAVMIDVDEQSVLAEQYQIGPIPTYMVINPQDGRAVKVGDSYRDPQAFLDWLHQPGSIGAASVLTLPVSAAPGGS